MFKTQCGCVYLCIGPSTDGKFILVKKCDTDPYDLHDTGFVFAPADLNENPNDNRKLYALTSEAAEKICKEIRELILKAEAAEGLRVALNHFMK